MTPLLGSPGRLTLVTWIVAALATVDVVLMPERAWSWLLCLALMTGIRLVVGRLSRSCRSGTERRALRNAGAFGGVVLVVALAIALLRALGVEHGWVSDRALGIVMGLTLLVLGNAIPKASVSPTSPSCGVGSHAMRRFAGWSFAGAGAIGLSAWLFAPIPDAGTIATVACFSAVALVVVRCVANPAGKAVD